MFFIKFVASLEDFSLLETVLICFINTSKSYFCEDISKLQIPEHYFLASFDVKSLFTNIPIHETVNIITNILFPEDAYEEHKVINLSKQEFLKLLETIIYNSYFVFNGQIF